MSNIYIQEPPTSGKVLLKTTVGDIDIELWSRECPLACRNFVQLCAEGYYNGTVFHRLVKGFIVQGGDPNGDGTGGESIYGHPFRDEFHSRLRFVRRGLVGMANSGGKHDNGSQFFFTLGPTQELQNVHTLFGKVAGDTIYNMLRLEEGEVYENERPHFPAKILKTEVLHNPFPDIVPRVLKAKKSEVKETKKKEKGVKNYGLLSFGDEAEEEEQETNEFVQKTFSGKSKSSHDVLDDPKLSKQAVDVKAGGSKAKTKRDDSGSEEEREDDDRGMSSRDKKQIERDAQAVRDKLKRKKEESKPAPPPKDSSSDSDSDFGLDSERKKVKQEQAAKIRDEISKLKKDYQSDKRKDRAKQTQEEESKKKKQATSEVMKEFLSVQEQYSEKKKQLPKKGSSRENFTLQLLEKFKNKLHNVQEQANEGGEEPESTAAGNGEEEEDVEQDIERGTWLSHRLQFEKNDPILAKDAVTKDDDWYDVYDPRNPLNKRKRGEKVEKRDKARK